jgi:hypothetical protein
MILTTYWFSLNGLFAQDNSLEDRLAFLQLERDDLDERKVSVLIEKYRVSELALPTGSRLNSERILQRFVRDGKSNLERIDAVKLNVLGTEDVNKSITEAQLVGVAKGIHYRGRYPKDQRFINFEVRSGATPVQTFSGRKHPFGVCSTNAVGNRRDGDKESMLSIQLKNKDIIEEKMLPDGRNYVKCYVANSAAIALTFNKEEMWCIEQVECFSDDKNSTNLKKSDPLDLKLYSTSKILWKKQGKREQLLPVVVFIEEDNVIKESWEIRFTEWKQGEDVDVSLLDEANFTEDKIKSSIDFQQIKNVFDSLPK